MIQHELEIAHDRLEGLAVFLDVDRPGEARAARNVAHLIAGALSSIELAAGLRASP